MYNERLWLNNSSSPSTGSIVAFDGDIRFRNKKEKCREKFLEIADCMCKVRLHQTADDSLDDFITKLKMIRDFTDKFITHLENP